MAATGTAAATTQAAPPGRGEHEPAAQRRRLLLAMVDAIGEGGYRSSTVVDVAARAGMSRKTFYKHFANRQECFLAAYDLVSGNVLRRVARAYGSAEGWPGRAQAAIAALFEAAGENPSALRLATIEICVLGPEGVERREESMLAYQRFIADAVELAPGAGTISELSARAVVGGLGAVLARRAASEGRKQLLALVPDLVRWATAYYAAPEVLGELDACSPNGDGRRVESAHRARRPPAGGRAPGTLAPQSALLARRGLARGKQNVSRSFVVHSQRERILDAVTNLTAERGYAAVGIDDIAAEAAVSLHAFYEHFADREDALLVAYEVGHGKCLAAAERAYLAEERWPQAIRAAIAALLDFLACEPAFARVALVDAPIATPRTSERSAAGVSAFAQLLLPGLEEVDADTRPPTVILEAITGGVFELCCRHALAGDIEQLPTLAAPATFIALAPFLGAEAAARIAAGDGATGERPVLGGRPL